MSGREPSQPRAAVLVESGIVGPGGHFVDFPIDRASLVVEVCRQIGTRQLWISRPAAGRLGLPERHEAPSSREADAWRYGVAHPWTVDLTAGGWKCSTEPAGFAPWLELERGGEHFDVVLAAWDRDNPFAAAAGARELLEALGLFSGLLGHRWRRSPSATGLSLMRAIPRRYPWPEAHLPPVKVRDRSSLWLTSDAIPEAGWLHAWDINGMYLAACSSAELGFGVPVEGRAQIGHAGYWLATLPAAGPEPLPWEPGVPAWYAAPMVELAREVAPRDVIIHEGWRYPERHRFLEPWYERLAGARSQLLEDQRPAARLALSAVKAVYTRSIGRLAGSWLEVGDQTFRPDWRDAIIARARANLWRHLRRIDEHGRRPIAVNADAVLFHHEHADPQLAAADLGLEVSPRLGKWKYLGSVGAGAAAAQGRESASRRARRLFGEVGAA